MATNQVYRLGIYEGILTIFFTAGGEMEVGDVVKLNDDGSVEVADAGDDAFGFAAQQVTEFGIADYAPGGLVSHTAKIGDVVGVYVAGGLYRGSDVSGEPSVGDILYLDAAGKLAASGDPGDEVAVLVEEPDEDGVYKFKSLVV